MIPFLMNNCHLQITNAAIVNKKNQADTIEIISGPGQNLKKLWTDENLRKLIYGGFKSKLPRETDELKAFFDEYVKEDFSQTTGVIDSDRISFHFKQGNVFMRKIAQNNSILTL